MNAVDILKYGHSFVVGNVNGLPEEAWHTPIVGVWSVKDLIAHLASFEQILVELLGTFQGKMETPTLAAFQASHAQFNDDEVERRQHLSASEVWAEYEAAHQQNIALMESIGLDERRALGTLPWYGPEYSLEDFIVYSFYGHKREHGAQIDMYRAQLSSEVNFGAGSVV